MDYIVFDPKSIVVFLMSLFGGCFGFNSGEPLSVAVSVPSFTTSPRSDDGAFLIEVRKDNSIWTRVNSERNPGAIQRVTEPVKQNLSNRIASYKASRNGRTVQFFISSIYDSNTNKSYQKVVNTLRENGEFKYVVIKASADQK